MSKNKCPFQVSPWIRRTPPPKKLGLSSQAGWRTHQRNLQRNRPLPLYPPIWPLRKFWFFSWSPQKSPNITLGTMHSMQGFPPHELSWKEITNFFSALSSPTSWGLGWGRASHKWPGAVGPWLEITFLDNQTDDGKRGFRYKKLVVHEKIYIFLCFCSKLDLKVLSFDS